MTSHPRFLGEVATAVADVEHAWPVASSEVGFANDYLSVTVDSIVGSGAEEHSRVVVKPRNAVAVAAIDEDDRLLLVHQYRHPVGLDAVEIPAGVRDVEGESPAAAAARELAEEAELRAGDWSHLLRLRPTPGFCSEQIDVYVARNLQPIADEDRFVREAEEAQMRHWWVPRDHAVKAVFDGRITDAKTVAAILAIAHA